METINIKHKKISNCCTTIRLDSALQAKQQYAFHNAQRRSWLFELSVWTLSKNLDQSKSQIESQFDSSSVEYTYCTLKYFEMFD